MYESYIYLYRVYKNDVVHDHDEYEGRVFIVVMFLYHVALDRWAVENAS